MTSPLPLFVEVDYPGPSVSSRPSQPGTVRLQRRARTPHRGAARPGQQRRRAPGEREPADLAAITSEALAAARPAISRLGLTVDAAIQPAALDGDPLLVEQLAANLIDNAIRHNIPNGDLQITTKTSTAGAVMSVTNSGQLIPPGKVDRLFQPFQRFGPRLARRDGGHGVGLSIVRAIATAHAATITAQPRPGDGLAIDVTFPRHPVPAPPRASTTQEPAETTPVENR